MKKGNYMLVNDQKRWNEIITDILREFIVICKENNLRYYTSGGTALGAVRHNGIIPWDDDIDVNMPRPDYERFLEICRNRDMGNYEIITVYNNPDYPLYFSKMCNKNTTLIEDSDTLCVMGLYIDIFPLDATADDLEEAYRMMCHFQKIKNRLEAISTHISFWRYLGLLSKPHDWGRFVYKTIGFFARKHYRHGLLKKLDSIAKSHNYEDAKNVMLYPGAYGRRDIYNKEWFANDVQLPFEGMMVSVPKCYDKYLTHLFGDYMQFPPEEERKSRHTKVYYNYDERLSLNEIRARLTDRH